MLVFAASSTAFPIGFIDLPSLGDFDRSRITIEVTWQRTWESLAANGHLALQMRVKERDYVN
ncbi:hypothetical protein OAH36_03255 [Verrucomicrobia bacterium]|nr:hypothetical protein [bacterium]MDB4798596.1 hypothetical protein [Verrucomicrobiota bacterium]